MVYRADCSGIPKERNYYDENNPDYADYEKMHDFKRGEEIEYFGGNIVRMEKIRDNTAGMVLGYTAGYIMAGIWITLQKKSGINEAGEIK